jgi:hypothetical protein
MVHHIPTEIILAFGELLDGPSLYASLQVSRQWYLALHQYAWVSITKKQWFHPTFPINRSTKLFPPFNETVEEMNATKILTCLRLTQSLEWNDIRIPRRPRSVNSNTALLPSTPPPPPVTLPDLAILFRLMPHLNHVNLAMARAFAGIPEQTLQSVINVKNLRNLRVLHLDLPDLGYTLVLEKMYPLLSQLEELNLRGRWFWEYDVSTRKYPNHAPWSLKRLTVDRVFIMFLGYCPALETISFKHPMSRLGRRMERTRETMLDHLQKMSNLRTITVGRSSDLKEDEFHIQEPMGPTALWDKNSSDYTREKGSTLHAIVDYLM